MAYGRRFPMMQPWHCILALSVTPVSSNTAVPAVDTMDMAGCLMEKGIPYSDLIDDAFYRKTYQAEQDSGLCPAEMPTCSWTVRMIVCVLERNRSWISLGAGHGDLEGVIDQLRLTKGH